MSRTWQMIMLGVVVMQGMGLRAMENKTPNSPRNLLNCSAEVRKEKVLIAATLQCERKQSSENLCRKEEKSNVATIMFYETPCGGGQVFYGNTNRYDSRDTRPWVPDYFPC